MSLLPFVLEHSLRPGRLLDQDFGLALRPDDLLARVESPLSLLTNDYYRPWRQLAAAARDIGSTIKSDKNQFQINLDVQHFSPEEVQVKVADGHVVVEGKHEEKQDEHGYISRQFVRRYALPADCDEARVESKLSSDGVLTVQVPRSAPPPVEGERRIPIQHTGPVKKQLSEK